MILQLPNNLSNDGSKDIKILNSHIPVELIDLLLKDFTPFRGIIGVDEYKPLLAYICNLEAYKKMKGNPHGLLIRKYVALNEKYIYGPMLLQKFRYYDSQLIFSEVYNNLDTHGFLVKWNQKGQLFCKASDYISVTPKFAL